GGTGRSCRSARRGGRSRRARWRSLRSSSSLWSGWWLWSQQRLLVGRVRIGGWAGAVVVLPREPDAQAHGVGVGGERVQHRPRVGVGERRGEGLPVGGEGRLPA